MDDKKILQHLLDLEKQAAAMVADAQEEADRRISEEEKKSRAHSEELCAREHEALEKVYIANNAALKENYQEQLDEYRDSLKILPENSACGVSPVYKLDREAFYGLAGKYLIGTGSYNRET